MSERICLEVVGDDGVPFGFWVFPSLPRHGDILALGENNLMALSTHWVLDPQDKGPFAAPYQEARPRVLCVSELGEDK